jgi:hypothetical protein
VKNFWSGSIYNSCEDLLEDDSNEAAKVISALQQLRLPTLESMSFSEQFTLFEDFLSALEPLYYLPIKSMEKSPYPTNRSGYVEISKEDAYDFVMTSALYLEGSNSIKSNTNISYLNAIFECFDADADFFVPTPHRVLTKLVFDAGVIVLEKSLQQLSILCYVNDQ